MKERVGSVNKDEKVEVRKRMKQNKRRNKKENAM